MAEHSPTPWRLNHPNLRVVIVDATGRGVVQASTGTDFAIDRANFALILRAVNAVAGPTDGPVDLEAALVHADGIDDGGLHEAANMVRALVGEVVRLREDEARLDVLDRRLDVIGRLSRPGRFRVILHPDGGYDPGTRSRGHAGDIRRAIDLAAGSPATGGDE